MPKIFTSGGVSASSGGSGAGGAITIPYSFVTPVVASPTHGQLELDDVPARSSYTFSGGSGIEHVQASVLAGGQLFAVQETFPGIITKWANPGDLTTHTSTTFPRPGGGIQDGNAADMGYDSTTGLIYI